MRLLLLGATGLVGGHVLERALLDPRITEVIAPVRRTLARREKLHATKVDFERLPETADWWAADAVICALGTTRRKAGSAEAFRHVDHDITLAALRLASVHGTPTLALVSAAGADARSAFLYSRVKGETENDVAALGFRSLTILRPGLIGGKRSERRLLERTAVVLTRAVQPMLPTAWRISPAVRIAARLVEAAVEGAPGLQVVGSSELA
jgi:uncharacterized protein YbjT (DUF2867 family)